MKKPDITQPLQSPAGVTKIVPGTGCRAVCGNIRNIVASDSGGHNLRDTSGARRRGMHPAVLLVCCVWLHSCASVPEAVKTQAPVTASIEQPTTTARDLHTVEFAATLVLGNPSDATARIDSVETRLVIQGAAVIDVPVALPADNDVAGNGAHVRPGRSLALPIALEQVLDAGSGEGDQVGRLEPEGRSEAGWGLNVVVRYHYLNGAAAGPALITDAAYRGTFPIVRPPQLSVTSIKIEKYELVNTRLSLSLSVYNPNVFPLDVTSMQYRLYGEGKEWADGSEEQRARIGAQETVELHVPVTMDFIETGRDLYDLVANLRVVRYRVDGSVTIDTSLEFLPSFVMPFNLQGSRKVER